MAIERKLVDSIDYKGHKIECRLLQPDLLGYIDGVEMPHMYQTTKAIFDLAKKQIDETEKEKQKLMDASAQKAPPKGRSRK